ncbi:MAG: hypothetical protein ACP5OZ_00975 [Candidatus Woesearchaeota archaeon]
MKKLALKILKSKSGDSELTIKSMFGIFIVLLVFFILYTVMQGNVGVKIQEQQFSSYYELENTFLSLLGSHCISIGNYSTRWQLPIQSVLDYKKLEESNNNQELWCVENFNFMYSLKITDLENGKVFNLGIKNYPNFSERTITATLASSIKYNATHPVTNGSLPEIHQARASLTIYTGNIPLFYGKIKKVCHSKTRETYNLITDYSISYDSKKNVFRVGDFYFYPYFSCNVRSFNLTRGKYLVVIDFKENQVIVAT